MKKKTDQRLGKMLKVPVGTLSTGQAARLVGVTVLTLRRWVERGWLKPVHKESGKGSVCGWRVNDLVAARTLVTLSERVSAKAIQEIVRQLKSYKRELSEAVIVLSPDEHNQTVFQVFDRERWTDAVTGRDVVKVMSLAPIMSAVEKEKAA